MPGMTGIAAVGQLLLSVGAAARSAKADVDDARASLREWGSEADAAERREVTSSMTKAGDGAVGTKALAASLQSLAGRRTGRK